MSGITATLYGHATQSAIEQTMEQVGKALSDKLEPFHDPLAEF